MIIYSICEKYRELMFYGMFYVFNVYGSRDKQERKREYDQDVRTATCTEFYCLKLMLVCCSNMAWSLSLLQTIEIRFDKLQGIKCWCIASVVLAN